MTNHDEDLDMRVAAELVEKARGGEVAGRAGRGSWPRSPRWWLQAAREAEMAGTFELGARRTTGCPTW